MNSTSFRLGLALDQKQSTTAEMMLLSGGDWNQSLFAAVGFDDGSLPGLDIAQMEQLLQSEWLQQNLSETLNISMDTLRNSAQRHEQEHDEARDPMWLVGTITFCYALIFIAGVLGNLITCIVISRNRFMHTATNFYLFNLAVSDLILLLSGMPQDLYNVWYPNSYPFTDVLCIMESVLSETAANATVLTITAFTVERYIAICHPFRQHTMSKLSRAIKFIFAIWVTASLLALPQAMQFSVVTENNGTRCTMPNDFFAHVFSVSGCIFFGGPMTAICVLYVLIGVKLKRSRLLQAVPRRCYDVNRGISAQSRVIRMLVAVAVAFFFCWAPFHAQRLTAVYASKAHIDSEVFNYIFHILDRTSGILYFLSTCINPLLYNIMSHKFREAFKVTLARQFGLTAMYQTPNHNYSALLRQNGSMRLHTTDSIRTTTTTTTVNGSGAGGGNSSCRSSHRNRCISAGSQSTLMTSLSKNDVFATNNTTTARTAKGAAEGLQHRMLQTQISQLSSVGDANSLMEADMGGGGGSNYKQHHHHLSSSQRLKELRRSLVNNDSIPISEKQSLDDCVSINSQEWEEHKKNLNILPTSVVNETELYPKTMAPVVAPMVAAPPIQPMNSIAELPSRSRLKLSRIISRRDRDSLVVQSSPRVELMRTHLPGMGHIPLAANDNSTKSNVKLKRGKPAKTLDSLAEKFHWRARKKSPIIKEVPTAVSGRRHMRHEPSMSEPTPTTALMRIAYPATTTTETALDAELSVQNGNSSFAMSAKAL